MSLVTGGFGTVNTSTEIKFDMQIVKKSFSIRKKTYRFNTLINKTIFKIKKV